MKIAVIGGGIFGVTTAIELAKNHDVTIYEKNSDIFLLGCLRTCSWEKKYT